MSICIRGNGKFITTLQFTSNIINVNTSITPTTVTLQTDNNIPFNVNLVYTNINHSTILQKTNGPLCYSIHTGTQPFTITLFVSISTNTVNRPITLESGLNGEIITVSTTFPMDSNGIIKTLLLSYYYVNSVNITKWTVFDINLIYK
jgi:hypothetical protein